MKQQRHCDALANAIEKVQMQFLLTFFCFGKKVR
jgi:hypothetical protein